MKSDDWRAYYEKTGARPPRETLIRALDAFEAEGRGPLYAVDLGCGGGRDIVEFLRRGWTVRGIDAEKAAIEKLAARDDLPTEGTLETEQARFETVALPDADLINSSFALPLCPSDAFPEMWARIRNAIRPGGRFSGQLYGDRDQWVGDPTLTFHTEAEVRALLSGFEIEFWWEEEDDSVTPRGHAKHWHIFHVVAKKPGDPPS